MTDLREKPSIFEEHSILNNIGKRILELRYHKQPKLHEIKQLKISRQSQYEARIDGDKYRGDNEILDDYEKERWNRQLNLPLINQKKIKNTPVSVFGCGGIGSNVLLGLAYGGVQNINIIDFDHVELSNLNRQTLYSYKDVGTLKVECANQRLIEINPKLQVNSYNLEIDYPKELNLLKNDEDLTFKRYNELNMVVKRSDFVVNAMDLNGAPYLINDLCVINKKPFYWGGINHFLGEIFSYNPKGNGACLRCIFGRDHYFSKNPYLRYRTKENNPQPSANISSTVIITGNLIAEMILKDISDIKNDVKGKYLIYDGYDMDFSKIQIIKDEKCECNDK